MYCVIPYNLHFSRSTGLSVVLVRGGDLLSLRFWGWTFSFVVTWEERSEKWNSFMFGPEVDLSGSIDELNESGSAEPDLR